MFHRKSTDALLRPAPEEARTASKLPLVVVLDNVRSMQNVGSVFRSCDAFGVGALYLCGYTPTPPHRDIQKTALGATETVAWEHHETIGGALEALRTAGYRIAAVEQAEGSTPLQRFSWNGREPLAVVLGNEVTGVSDAALAAVDACIEIPQAGAKHSLNVSVAAGVVLWECVRSRSL